MLKWPEDFLNRIIQGDCLEVMKQMPDKCVDLVLTDPPYGLGRKMHDGGTWSTNPMYDNMLQWDIKPVGDEYIQEILRISKNQVVWGGHLYNLPKNRCWISWSKSNSPPSMGDFELAWTSFDEPCRQFDCPVNPPGHLPRKHPTQKPMRLFKWILKNYSDQNQIILDPFLGSGTTAIAAAQLGRKFIGVEISEAYVEIARERLKRETQQTNMFLPNAGTKLG